MVKNSGQAKIGLLLIALVFVVLAIFAFTKKADNDKKKDNFTGVSNTATNSSQTNPENGDIKSEKLANNYFIFKKESYESTITYKLPVFLFFYNNACSECEKQESVTIETFNNLGKNSVIGFRVNYADNDTSQDEKDLAKKFGIKDDLVMVILDNNGQQQHTFTSRVNKETLSAALNKVNTIR